jgi:glycosyltransferase involved in cell wall biosynthesis
LADARAQAALVMLSNFGRADGGRETWAYNFVPRLLARYPGLRLSVFGMRTDGEADNRDALRSAVGQDDRDRLAVDFVEAKAGRRPNAFAFWAKLRRLVARRLDHPPALVLAVGSWVELLAVLLTPRFRRSAKLVWLRSVFADEKAHRYPSALRHSLEWFEVAVLRRADVVIANGQDTARRYRALGLSPLVIPNGVDLDRWRMPPASVDGPLDVAFIGRVTPAKGIDAFVELARLAGQSGPAPALRFHVIGDAPDGSLTKAAHAEGLLEYRGPVSNESLPAVLGSMHVCAALTFVHRRDIHESGGAGVSNALLEQMAAGRIMLCWDNEAFRQVLSDDSAYFVRQGDVGALLDALLAVIGNPVAAHARAQRAAEIAANYGLERHMDLFDEAARRWLSGQAGHSGAKIPARNS